MKIVYSDRFLEHTQGPDHPECLGRLVTIKNYIKEKMKCEFIEPGKINEKEILLVHSKGLIESLKQNSAEQLSFPDNRFSKNTFEIAKLAVVATQDAANTAIEDGFAFALVRPPGHHAANGSFGGFCYLNNIAFAIRRMQKVRKIRKAMIIDIDFHHGNGTQDIFYNDKSVFYLSLHADPLCAYPRTGFECENNDHILNVPLSKATNDGEYLENLKAVLKRARAFKPGIIGISAGFDTYYLDPIAGLGIEKSETYYEIGKIIKETFECPKFGVLEGGYYLPKLGENCYNLLKAFE